ncbi:hypothetical protein DUI87_25028 [Hirundo rustica rustica]|uniref:Uncharacterized protein n=1 Tax=Hirundo rustica rustica TaxID=333673 RepID=A0A3M0JJE7_HIRRU|nr:hypothetical protein DUI87_25028 [Hirundo rustica rustica]
MVAEQQAGAAAAGGERWECLYTTFGVSTDTKTSEMMKCQQQKTIPLLCLRSPGAKPTGTRDEISMFDDSVPIRESTYANT